jgi:hypothetical protein
MGRYCPLHWHERTVLGFIGLGGRHFDFDPVECPGIASGCSALKKTRVVATPIDTNVIDTNVIDTNVLALA